MTATCTHDWAPTAVRLTGEPLVVYECRACGAMEHRPEWVPAPGDVFFAVPRLGGKVYGPLRRVVPSFDRGFAEVGGVYAQRLGESTVHRHPLVPGAAFTVDACFGFAFYSFRSTAEVN